MAAGIPRDRARMMMVLIPRKPRPWGGYGAGRVRAGGLVGATYQATDILPEAPSHPADRGAVRVGGGLGGGGHDDGEGKGDCEGGHCSVILSLCPVWTPPYDADLVPSYKTGVIDPLDRCAV